jgi:hypothetical protein
MAKKVESVIIKGKTFTKQSIKDMLLANDGWLYRAILAIYKGQTDGEQACGATVEDNGIGFNGADAVILSSFAQQLNRTGTLSYKQTFIARKKMVKYAGQLLSIAREKQA